VLLLELVVEVVLLQLEGLLHQGVLLRLLGHLPRHLEQVLLVSVLGFVVGPVVVELVRFLQL